MTTTLTTPAPTAAPGSVRIPATFATNDLLQRAIEAAEVQSDRTTRIMVVAGLKGGLGKTTSAILMALAWHRQGKKVAVLDADPMSQSARSWAADAEAKGTPLPFPIIPFAQIGLAEHVATHLIGCYDVIIIDTGGDGDRLMREACRVASDLLMVIGPDEIDLKRLPATWKTASIVAQETDRDFTAHVLLVRCPTSSTMADTARGQLAEVHIEPLRVTVPNQVMYRRAYGTLPDDLGAYTVVREELDA